MQRNSRVIGFFCFMLLFIFNCSVCLSQNQRQETPLTRILFVFDGSQSMYGRWKTGMKIKIAQKLLGELMDSISYRDDIQLAFRAYGHQYPVISREKRNCEDSKLEVPFGKNVAIS